MEDYNKVFPTIINTSKKILEKNIFLPGAIMDVSNTIAYFRLDDRFYKFLKTLGDQYEIDGFEWEMGARNFGVVLGKKKHVQSENPDK